MWCGVSPLNGFRHCTRNERGRQTARQCTAMASTC
jgi:hypothetical protein